MFMFSMLITRTSETFTGAITLICPNACEADKAEEDMFYEGNGPKGMIFVRQSPTTIRMEVNETYGGYLDRMMKTSMCLTQSQMNDMFHKLPYPVDVVTMLAMRNLLLVRLACHASEYSEIKASGLVN